MLEINQANSEKLPALITKENETTMIAMKLKKDSFGLAIFPIQMSATT